MPDRNKSLDVKQTVQDLLGLIGTLKFWLAFIGIFLSVGAYYWISTWIALPDTFAAYTKSFLLGFIPNILPALFLVLLTYLIMRRAAEYQAKLDRELVVDLIEDRLKPLFDKELHSIRLVERFISVNWHELFSHSYKLQIVVHYLDSWISSHPDEIRKFLQRGGEITLIIPNPDIPCLIQQIHTRFPDKAKKDIANKIRQTANKLIAFKKGYENANTKVNIVYVDVMIWYCAMVFDDDILVLSPFEHARDVVVDAPAICIQLNKYPRVKEWWEREIRGLNASQSK